MIYTVFSSWLTAKHPNSRAPYFESCEELRANGVEMDGHYMIAGTETYCKDTWSKQIKRIGCHGVQLNKILKEVIVNLIFGHSQMAIVEEDLPESMMFVLMYPRQLVQRKKSMRSAL